MLEYSNAVELAMMERVSSQLLHVARAVAAKVAAERFGLAVEPPTGPKSAWWLCVQEGLAAGCGLALRKSHGMIVWRPQNMFPMTV